MRVALYHVDLPSPGHKPGGAAVAVHRLANALSDRGHDTVLHSYSSAPADALYAVRRLHPERAARSMVLRQYLAPFARNFDLRGPWDVVHLHGDDWFYWWRPVPTVRTFHGSSLQESRSATGTARRIDKRIVFELERFAARLADVTVADAPDPHSGLTTDLVIPLGFDVGPPSRAERTPSPSVLFVGTWEGRKRGRFLAEVFASQIRNQLPQAELWMVADRCEEQDGIRWFPAPTDAELRDLYRRAWVFCLPSTYEGFGIPYVEALAAGTPVVSSHNPGVDFILRGGRDGEIVQDDELGPALAALLTDASRRDHLGRAGKERAQAFSWPSVVDAHERAYALAIDNHARRRYTLPRR